MNVITVPMSRPPIIVLIVSMNDGLLVKHNPMGAAQKARMIRIIKGSICPLFKLINAVGLL